MSGCSLDSNSVCSPGFGYFFLFVWCAFLSISIILSFFLLYSLISLAKSCLYLSKYSRLVLGCLLSSVLLPFELISSSMLACRRSRLSLDVTFTFDGS